MRNSFTEYKRLLITFTYQEQIDELTRKIREILVKIMMEI